MDRGPVHEQPEIAGRRGQHLGHAEEAPRPEVDRRLEHERGEDEHERGREREEPRSRPDEQDQAADEQPADARLGGQRARRDEAARSSQATDHEIRQRPATEPGHERAEVEAHGRVRVVRAHTRGDQGERDECADQQDRVLPDVREDDRRRGARRTPRRARRRSTGSGRTRSGAPGPAGPGRVGRGGRSRRSRTRPAPSTRSTGIGQPPAEPYGHPQQRDHRRRREDGQPDEPTAARRERHDERGEVDRQRRDPQQRRRDEVRGDEVGDRGQQAGRDRGQEQPAETPRPVDRRGRGRPPPWPQAPRPTSRCRSSGAPPGDRPIVPAVPAGLAWRPPRAGRPAPRSRPSRAPRCGRSPSRGSMIVG